MNKIFLSFLLIFFIFSPCPCSAWELRNKSVPFDSHMAQNIQRWRNQHNWEFSSLLTATQQVAFDQIVRGVLNWAYTRGNHFDCDEFLGSFDGRDNSVLTLFYPNGGLGLVIRGAYVRVELDQSRPEFLSSDVWKSRPEAGRWYAEIGCSSQSQIFYFLAATPVKTTHIACHTNSCPVEP